MAEYDTITAANQTHRIGNETFENKLIDVSNGNGITFIVEGGATIRNIGIKGLYRGNSFIFSITSDDPVTFENIYIGDGANKDGESFVHGPGAIFYHASASGDVTFRECNVQGYPNNGWYCSNSAGRGAITWERCFGKNNGVSTFRAANSDDTLRECVAYNDGTDYSSGGHSWGDYAENDGRPLWVWSPGGCTVEDCHFAAGSYPSAVLTHEGASVTLRGGGLEGGTQGAVKTDGVSDTADLSLPDGVPTSAEAAASGASGNGNRGADGGDGDDTEDSADPDWEKTHVYELEQTGDETVQYWLEAESGAGFEVSEFNDADAPTDKWVSDDGDRVSALLESGAHHAWTFDTSLLNVHLSNDDGVVARVNDQPSHLSRYPLEDASDSAWMADVEFERGDSGGGGGGGGGGEGDGGGGGNGDEKGRLRDRIADLEAERDDLAAEVEALETERDELADRVETLEERLDDARSILDNAPAVVARFRLVEDDA